MLSSIGKRVLWRQKNRVSNFSRKMGDYFAVFLAVGRNVLRMGCSFRCTSEVGDSK